MAGEVPPRAKVGRSDGHSGQQGVGRVPRPVRETEEVAKGAEVEDIDVGKVSTMQRDVGGSEEVGWAQGLWLASHCNGLHIYIWHAHQ